MYKVIITAIFISISPQVLGQDIIVMRGRHMVEVDDKNTPSEPRANKLAHEIMIVARQTGWNPTFIDEECEDVFCLNEAVRKYGANEAIAANVNETDLNFDYELVLAKGSGFESKTITLYKYSDLNDAVLKSAKEILEVALRDFKEESSLKKSDKKHDVETEIDKERKQEQVSAISTKKKKRLLPTAFWTSLVLTGTFAMGAGIVDAIGYSRARDLNRQDIWSDSVESRKETLRKLKVLDGILFGCAAAGAATTVVLLFLTDFNGRREKKTSMIRLDPVVSPHGGFFLIRGEF